MMQVPIKKDPEVKVFEYPLEMLYNERVERIKMSEKFWRINPSALKLDIAKIGENSKITIEMLKPNPNVQRD
jgi:hypothetical protein